MRILGLDISKSTATGCLLSEKPKSVKRFWQTIRKDESYFFYFQCTAEAIDQLRALAPDLIVLEPTGSHYSRIWDRLANLLNIPILWVGHMEVANHRKGHRLPSKNDRADAYALADYAWQHLGDEEYFLHFTPGAVMRIRELGLQLETIQRISTALINRTRQQLAHEFPEAALKESRGMNGNLAPLWSWLAQQPNGASRKQWYYPQLYERSIARELGTEISDFTRRFAAMIRELEIMENDLGAELRSLVLSPEFEQYNRVFSDLGMGMIVRSWILSSVYPVTPAYTLKAFKLRLGMGLVEHSSGDKNYWAPGGSKYCRKHLWLWVVTRIAPNSERNKRPQSAIAQRLCEYYDYLATDELRSPKMARLRISRTVVKACKLMYDELSLQLGMKC